MLTIREGQSSVADCSCSSHGSFLTAKGLEEAAQRFSLEDLSPRGVHEYVDKSGSVSALVEVEDNGMPELQRLKVNLRLIPHG